MTTQATNGGAEENFSAQTIDAVMAQVSRAQRYFELSSIRFVDYRATYDTAREKKEPAVRIGITDQSVALHEEILQVGMRFEFIAPSPFPEQQDKQVEILAKLRLEYIAAEGHDLVDNTDTEMFGRVNGIYNAWPYLREFVQSNLMRLGLPQFELPLLRVGAAVQLAGLVHPPPEDANIARNANDH